MSYLLPLSTIILILCSLIHRTMLGQSCIAWLAQLGERQSAEWEVVGSNPGWTNTQGPGGYCHIWAI